MTISDKIRIYELSRDLNLENKDILDAAQKLSISVKSHSSSITAEDAKKIKNLINKKNSDKKILSINKPSIKKEIPIQNKENKSSVNTSIKEKTFEDNTNKKQLLNKPLNKPEGPKPVSNQPKILTKPSIVSKSQSQVNLRNQNLSNRSSQNFKQDKKPIYKSPSPPINSPAKPPIQLIEKPKNLTNNLKTTKSSETIYNSGNKRQLSNKSNQNNDKFKPKIPYNKKKYP